MEISKYIDHTLLKPDASEKQIRTLCNEALEYGFYAVCVNSCYVPLAAEILSDSDVKIASVIGFPLGAMSTASKAFEADDACRNGADEIDMVINVGKMKSGDYRYVKNDIAAVCSAAAEHNAAVKVIIETCLLTREEKIKACAFAAEAGALFVKTSTGFSTGGASEDDVRLMKSSVPAEMKVKAAGGIRDYETAVQMIKAGADRIGTSSGPAIIKGQK